MTLVYLRFYEELNDFLPPEKRKVLFEHTVKTRSSVKDVIEAVGVPHTEIDLILVNGKSVYFNYIVQEHDTISVYPVFESFDISEVTHLREKPLRNIKFICDVHLGRLARYLRMLGFDCLYSSNYSKDEIVGISLDHRRTILTRDRNLLKRNEITQSYWIRNENPTKQVKEVLERFHLEKDIKGFTRCMECSGLLEKVEKDEIIDLLPPKVKEYHNEFYRCTVCRRIYWQGTHYENMKKMIEKIQS